MPFKKNLTLLIIFQILIFSIFITPSFSEKKTTLVDLLPGVKTKSPLLKLPRKLGNGSIITFTSYDAYEFKQILNGLHKSNPIKVTGHLTFPVGDGTTSGNVPVIIILHGNGGPYEFLDRQTSWFQDIQKSLLKAGIGVFYIDSFTGRGVENSYKDQYKVSLVSQAIDTIMAYKFLKNHPRVNANKIGVTGSSRGGTIPFIVADKKFTNQFLIKDEGFAAILSMSAECRMSKLFENPEMTKNSKMLFIQGSLDDINSCKEYVEKMKANGGEVEFDLKDGWHHNFIKKHKERYNYKLYQYNSCPPYYIKDDGDISDEMLDFFLVKRKAWKSKEHYYNNLYEKPRKTYKKMIKNLVKSKCAKQGVRVGGERGKEFTPQFLGFFRENLL